MHPELARLIRLRNSFAVAAGLGVAGTWDHHVEVPEYREYALKCVVAWLGTIERLPQFEWKEML